MIRALRNTHEPRVQDASALNLCLMPETSVRPAEGARRSFQLGIGGRLFLGLTAVAGVPLGGVGSIFLGAGIPLLVVGKDDERATKLLVDSIGPMANDGGAGIGIKGRF